MVPPLCRATTYPPSLLTESKQFFGVRLLLVVILETPITALQPDNGFVDVHSRAVMSGLALGKGRIMLRFS